MTTSAECTELLRLVAFDEEDLAVMSAHLQDAQVPVSELAYLNKERRFALAGRRFDWVKAAAGGCERSAVGLHFECVLGVSKHGFDQGDADRVLNLLAINFEAGDAPGGTVTMTFSGHAAVKLDVECVEARLSDLGDRCTCNRPPKHDVDSNPSAT